MPKHYKAQLNHKSFDWLIAFDRICADLETCREQVLDTVGFYDLYEREASDPTRATQIKDDAKDLIKEIGEVLTKAATIQVEAGFKPPNQLIASVRAIEREPEEIERLSVEDEALCMVASQYQRGNEKPGTHWYDVTGELLRTMPPLV